MIAAAVWVLTVAVAAGVLLALWHLRATDSLSRPPRTIGIAHGVVGAIGFAALLLALRGPARGVEAGVASFGSSAAFLVAAALVTGLAILWLRRKAIVMTIHAAIAITGYVLLMAWNSLG